MSLWQDVKHHLKKGALFVWGPAQLDPHVDPNVRLDEQHDGQPRSGNPGSGKDWDRG